MTASRLPPGHCNGIRIGTPAVTTRGMKEPEMRRIGGWISEILQNLENESVIQRVRREVEVLTEQFPLYERRRAAVSVKA